MKLITQLRIITLTNAGIEMSNHETELIPHLVKNLQGRMEHAEVAEKEKHLLIYVHD